MSRNEPWLKYLKAEDFDASGMRAALASFRCCNSVRVSLPRARPCSPLAVFALAADLRYHALVRESMQKLDFAAA